MPRTRRLRAAVGWLLLALAASATSAAVAAERTFAADYAVKLRGLPVATATLKAEFGDETFAIRFSGAPSAFAKLVADVALAAAADGPVTHQRLAPAHYTHRWAEKKEIESVDMQITEGSAVAVVDPPVRHPERYVPVTAADRTGVADPLSAFFWPDVVDATPGICDRTIPVFDGLRRFDFVLSFSRIDAFTASDATFRGPAVVCAVSYKPISGHRRNKKRGGFMPVDKDSAIWLARMKNGLVVPVRVAIPTRFGLLSLEARRIR